jgi:restriction endonuclease S subunit
MRINVGSIGVALTEEQTGITSPDYVVFRCNDRLHPEYLYHYLRSEAGLKAIAQKTRGSVRFRLYYDRLATISIPLPDEATQEAFVGLCRAGLGLIGQLDDACQAAREFLEAVRREGYVSGQSTAKEGSGPQA